jgi:hypothetical protein
LYFFPLPHGQGSFRPTLGILRFKGGDLITRANPKNSRHF